MNNNITQTIFNCIKHGICGQNEKNSTDLEIGFSLCSLKNRRSSSRKKDNGRGGDAQGKRPFATLSL